MQMRFSLFNAFEILLILIQLSEQNPIKKHHQNKNNIVIKAEIGQYINISCFDSNLFIQRDEIDNENKLTSFSLPDMFETKKKYRRENNFNYKFKLNDDNALDAWPNHNNKEEQQNSKYEIDWYFLDNKGRMNIISYGNQTTKISKYRTFLTSVNGNTRSLGNNNLSKNNQKLYTYYLNTLIESEDDEGVYQCINPDWPNFVIRNITVLISRNNSNNVKSSVKHIIYLLLFKLWLIK